MFMLALSSVMDKTEAWIHKNAVSCQENVLCLILVDRLRGVYIGSLSI